MNNLITGVFFIICLVASGYAGYKIGAGELNEAKEMADQAEASLKQMEVDVAASTKEIEEKHKIAIEKIQQDTKKQQIHLLNEIKQYKEKAEYYDKKAETTLKELFAAKQQLSNAIPGQRTEIETRINNLEKKYEVEKQKQLEFICQNTNVPIIE